MRVGGQRIRKQPRNPSAKKKNRCVEVSLPDKHKVCRLAFFLF